MPKPLEGHSVTKINPNYALVCGGYDGIGLSNAIYQFDIHQRTTTQLDLSLSIARENHAAVLLNNNTNSASATGRAVGGGGGHSNIVYLIIIGGWDGHKALDDCEVFEVRSEVPFLIKINDHQLKLCVPRNKPAAAIVVV